jgi:hypothetical protein
VLTDVGTNVIGTITGFVGKILVGGIMTDVTGGTGG